MGELLDALNAADPAAAADEARSAFHRAAERFRLASRRVNEAIEAAQESSMLETISQWARKAPIQALTAAFLLGVMVARRRRR